MTDEDRELDESIRTYERYIEEHRGNVARAFESLFRPYFEADEAIAHALSGTGREELSLALHEAEGLVAIHDMSKYDDEEFEPYRVHFYPTARERELVARGVLDEQANFMAAFRRHCDVNPHHPLHWADGEGRPSRDMALEYVIEAICDWEGMAMRFGGTTRGWWETRAGRDRSTMTGDTLVTFDRMIRFLFPAG